MCKKVANCLAVSGEIRTFAPMERDKYVITAISKLSGTRVEISGPMSEDAARLRLEKELASRKRQKYAAYTRLRVERRQPVQLTLQFDE